MEFQYKLLLTAEELDCLGQAWQDMTERVQEELRKEDGIEFPPNSLLFMETLRQKLESALKSKPILTVSAG